MRTTDCCIVCDGFQLSATTEVFLRRKTKKYDLVQEGYSRLLDVTMPFMFQTLRGAYGDDFASHIKQVPGPENVSWTTMCPYLTILEAWSVFEPAFASPTLDLKSAVSVLQEARVAVSRAKPRFNQISALRYMSAMQQLANAIGTSPQLVSRLSQLSADLKADTKSTRKTTSESSPSASKETQHS